MDLPITFIQSGQTWIGKFRLMASGCEIHIRTSDLVLAKSLIAQAYREGLRIERHFSRYLDNNLLYAINASQGKAVTLDDEYKLLFDYALTMFQISDGMFDISSGVLRRVWTFDNRTHDSPGIGKFQQEQLDALLDLIGLDKVSWNPPELQMPHGMELDFGGIGKEYAVDRGSQVIERQFKGDYLVNFGGDCYCRGDTERPWSIAVESAGSAKTSAHYSGNSVTLTTGGVATSGTTKRYFEHKGQRFGHILNPKTGWPIADAPLSVTVVNENCLAAGAVSTLAMLQGAAAEAFLAEQDLLHWVLR